jgi:hypothetical protein
LFPDRWLKYIDDGNLVGTVFLDLKKALDMVDHKLLCKKFQYYKISTNSIKWFESMFTEFRSSFKVASISNIFLPLMLKVVSSAYISISNVKFSSGRSLINILKSRGIFIFIFLNINYFMNHNLDSDVSIHATRLLQISLIGG